MLHAWVDGSVIGGHWGKKTGPKKPTQNYIGWVIRRSDGSYVHHHSFYCGQAEWMTGNTAESFGFNSLLRWLLANGYGNEDILIHSDSQCSVGHLQGVYECYNERLLKLLKLNKAMLAQFKTAQVKWVRREENTVADRLSKALQEKFEGRPLTREEVEALFGVE